MSAMDMWTQLAPEEGQLHGQLLALEAEIESMINAVANATAPLSKAQQVTASNRIADAFKTLRAHIHQLDLLADEQDTCALSQLSVVPIVVDSSPLMCGSHTGTPCQRMWEAAARHTKRRTKGTQQ